MTTPSGDKHARGSFDARIAALATTQYGVLSRAQAVALGATHRAIEHRLANGRWTSPHRGVYRVAGVPASWHQALKAACLAWGDTAVASHRSAAALWRIAGPFTRALEITVPRGGKRGADGVTVHHPMSLDAADVTVKHGIHVTTPGRTLLDLAAVLDRPTLEEALDDATRTKLVSLARLRWMANESDGRPGIVALRALLDARDHPAASPQSVLERKLLRLVRAHGLPEPAVQHEIRERGRLIAIVDLAYRSPRVAIEADSYRWHSGRDRWEHDLARRNALTARGWRVIHVTWDDVTRRPADTARVIADALGLA